MVLRVIIRDIDESLIYIESDDFFLFERGKKNGISKYAPVFCRSTLETIFIFIFILFFYSFSFPFWRKLKKQKCSGKGGNI